MGIRVVVPWVDFNNLAFVADHALFCLEVFVAPAEIGFIDLDFACEARGLLVELQETLPEVIEI